MKWKSNRRGLYRPTDTSDHKLDVLVTHPVRYLTALGSAPWIVIEISLIYHSQCEQRASVKSRLLFQIPRIPYLPW